MLSYSCTADLIVVNVSVNVSPTKVVHLLRVFLEITYVFFNLLNIYWVLTNVMYFEPLIVLIMSKAICIYNLG